MRKKNFKGRCEKKTIGKCKTVCKTFDPIDAKKGSIPITRNLPLSDLVVNKFSLFVW